MAIHERSSGPVAQTARLERLDLNEKCAARMEEKERGFNIYSTASRARLTNTDRADIPVAESPLSI